MTSSLPGNADAACPGWQLKEHSSNSDKAQLTLPPVYPNAEFAGRQKVMVAVQFAKTSHFVNDKTPIAEGTTLPIGNSLDFLPRFLTKTHLSPNMEHTVYNS